MEADGCGRGPHQQAPVIAGLLLKSTHANSYPPDCSPAKFKQRKFSQTFMKRQSPEWKPAVRRYSVETGQLQCQQHQQQQQQINYNLEYKINFKTTTTTTTINDEQCSGTERVVLCNRDELVSNKPCRCSQTSALHEHHHNGLSQDSEGTLRRTNTTNRSKLCDCGTQVGCCYACQCIQEKHLTGNSRSSHLVLASDNPEKEHDDESDVQQTDEFSGTKGTETTATATTTADVQGDSVLRHQDSGTASLVSTGLALTRTTSQNKLTRLTATSSICSAGSSLLTCCTTVPSGNETVLTEQAQGQQQQHRRRTVSKWDVARRPCSVATLEDALAANMTEKLQLQEKQRKHVILSMALKHMIAPEHSTPSGSVGQSTTTGELSLDGSCGCRSRSCSFGPSKSVVAAAAVSARGASRIEPSVSMVFDDKTRLEGVGKNFNFGDRFKESGSILFVSSNQQQNFDSQHNPLGERATRCEQYAQSRRFSGSQDAARQVNLQTSKTQTQLTNPMRQLVTSKLADDQWRDLSSPSDCFERFEPDDRPRSTLESCERRVYECCNNQTANQDETYDQRTPTRRSCSAFGKPSKNCDSLYAGLSSNQCETNLEALIVESWLDDHPDFTRDYFMRKASRQMIDAWLMANAKVSNTNLSSQLDLRSINSISRPMSQISLSGHLRGSLGGQPWRAHENISASEAEYFDTQYLGGINNQGSGGTFDFMRPNRSNSQSAAGMASSRALAGSLTPIRKISATDFETRSGSGFLRPMLSKTPDGRLTFLPQANFTESPILPQQPSLKMVCLPERTSSVSITGAGGGGLVLKKSETNQSNAITMGHADPASLTDTCHRVICATSQSDAAIAENFKSVGLSDRFTDESRTEHGRIATHEAPSDEDENEDSDLLIVSDQSTTQDEGELRMIFELVKNIYDDLDIRTLLHKILKNIAVLINADRSSLFLVCGGPGDPNRRLVSQLFNVDQNSPEVGDMDETITIPWGMGLVGFVAESGEAVNIENCYEDPRFTDAIDQRTGYVTRHMLCAPILDKRNEIVGVAQVINKRDGNPFSKNDEMKFKRYLQFCGIGLRNAQSYEQCQLENRRNQVLLDLARMVFEEQSTIEQVVHRIMLHTQSLLDCERCQVLLIDNGSDELENLLHMPSARQTNVAGPAHCPPDTQQGELQSTTCRKQTEWRPQCSKMCPALTFAGLTCTDGAAAGSDTMPMPELKRPGGGDPLIGATDNDFACDRRGSQQHQTPRLFSLVFDLECGVNDDPVIYDNRSGKEALSAGGASASSKVNRAFPINIGITGYVATTGETLNIENAHENERFDKSVDEGTDFVHKSILCMPIRNGQRQIIGVIQLINKKNGQPFNKNDEDLFEAFAIFCGLGIHNTLMYERVLKVMAKQRVTFEVLSYHATAPLEEAKKLSQEQVPSCFALNLASLKFNDFSLDEQYMLKSCLRFFLDLDLMRRFQIDQLVFCNWILSVQKNYRKVTYHPIVGGTGLKASPVRYHNWRHAFNVSQMMFAILVNTQICHSLGELETLALLIACLCHDLDHRGTTNSFQIKSASPLAELYSTSTMEHHHFDQCVMILNSQGNQILSNLSPEEYSRVIMLLEEAILATDLANYFRKRDHFFQLVNSDRFDWRRDPEHRSILRCMLMTACDVAAITKPWPVQKVVADLVMSEFYQQGDIERNELNIEPIDMMNRDKMSELPKMQKDFIDTICAPIYTAFARLFPQELDSLLDGCLTNRALWQEVSEGKTKPDVPLINYLVCDTDGPELENNDRTHAPTANCCLSKSETNLPRLLVAEKASLGKEGNQSKMSISASAETLQIQSDLHDMASQETVIAAGGCCDLDHAETRDSELRASVESSCSASSNLDSHRRSL